MRDQRSSSDAENSDSDEEAPAVQLCILPLEKLRTLCLRPIKDLNTLLTILADEESENAYLAAQQIRKFLSTESEQSICEVIKAGGVDILHRAMKHEDEGIRYEAVWAITNLLAGNSINTAKVLKSGCIATLLDIMKGQDSWDIK